MPIVKCILEPCSQKFLLSHLALEMNSKEFYKSFCYTGILSHATLGIFIKMKTFHQK